MTQGSDTDALQRERIVMKKPSKGRPGPKPKNLTKATIRNLERQLRK